MTTTSTPNEPTRIESSDLTRIFQERARQHSRNATFDMAIIIVVLFLCISIFAGTDRIADFIFKSPIEKQADKALAEAEAKLYLAIADLAVPTAEAIRALPSNLRPIVEKYFNQITGKKSPKSKTENSGDLGTEKSLEIASKDHSSKSKESFKADDNLYSEPIKLNLPSLPATNPSKKRVVSGKALLNNSNRVLANPLQEYDVSHSQILALQNENAALYRQLSQVNGDIEIAMYKTDVEREIAMYKANVERDIAESKADVERDIAESKADVERAKADSEEAVATGSTDLAREWNSLVSSAITRIGSVVLILWLVRIFIRKRERSVRLAAFYLAVGDAITLCGGNNLNQFSKMLPSLLPPEVDNLQNLDSPAGEIVQLAKALLQARTNGS